MKGKQLALIVAVVVVLVVAISVAEVILTANFKPKMATVSFFSNNAKATRAS